MIRVLIVDDSPTMRLLLRSALESDAEIEVVGEARDGEHALTLARQFVPDLITMDIEMPKMNGFEAIQRIMRETPCPIIVLSSQQSDEALGISFRAMEVGALAVIAKPKGLIGQDPELGKLVEHVKSLSQVKVVQRQGNTHHKTHLPPKIEPDLIDPLPESIEIVAIGASTGGPQALQILLNNLSPDIQIPVVIVQHISQGFVGGLARWLDETTPWKVELAVESQRLKPRTAYLAPDNCHLLFYQPGQVMLDCTLALDGHRPSVTALFKSMAKVYRGNVVATLLTGMGRDGADGLKMLRDVGAHTIVQDEASCVIFGMPRQAILLDAASEVLPLLSIGSRINALVAASWKAKK